MAVQVPVAAPVRQKRLGGLRAAATWVTDARIGFAESLVYVSDGCTLPQPAIGLCFGPEVTDEKVGEGIDWFDGIIEPFALYGGVECYLGMDADTEFPARARTIVLDGEDRAIESRLNTWALAGTDVGDSADIVEAIANVEQEADENYLGRPVILMSRADAVRAAAAVAIEYGIDGLPYTVNGTPVVASGAIPAGTVSAVGAVTVLRTALNDVNTIDHVTNRDFAIAEATYGLLVDCGYRVTTTIA